MEGALSSSGPTPTKAEVVKEPAVPQLVPKKSDKPSTIKKSPGTRGRPPKSKDKLAKTEALASRKDSQSGLISNP